MRPSATFHKSLMSVTVSVAACQTHKLGIYKLGCRALLGEAFGARHTRLLCSTSGRPHLSPRQRLLRGRRHAEPFAIGMQPAGQAGIVRGVVAAIHRSDLHLGGASGPCRRLDLHYLRVAANTATRSLFL